MGEEAERRNTDCVYFLASPLTCKKGADCEYRHSEAARVNPRDCWYWLSGNCLNATCSFRHPPLDGRPGGSTGNHPSQPAGGASCATATTTSSTVSSSIPSTSTTTVSAPPSASKSTVLCFFFSQGYCAKGVKCPFLHGPAMQYRKEATTYQRLQVSDQPENGEGSGASNKDQKSAAQIKGHVGAAPPSQEGGCILSNVYKLSASTVPSPSGKCLPGNSGEKVEQATQIGRPKLNDMIRSTQLVESRITQGHVSNEFSEQLTLVEKGSLKIEPSHLVSNRTTMQVQQYPTPYIARSNDALINSEIQDPINEPERQDSAHELCADDLRNHLKRKKNDCVLKDFCSKDFTKDHVEGARLASSAVTVTEPKDFVPVNNKRAKQKKESIRFSGPKSLAQIKAEKSKAATQGSSKAVNSISDRRNREPDLGERKDVFNSASEHHESILPEFCKELVGNHSTTSIGVNSVKPKNIINSGDSESGGSGQNSRSCVSVSNSNGRPSVFVPSTAFQETEMTVNHSSGVAAAPTLKRQHSLRNETPLGGMKCVKTSERTYPEMGCDSPDGLMENGLEASENIVDVDSAFDYDEEDDFTRKLGSYLS